ncbi:MAG: FecR family protein [Spirochaetaceae bacterium]|nr:FecR family protein [Spirochaetaceae bacterium]
MKKRKNLLIAVLLALPFCLRAQEAAVLRLYYVEGDEITLTIAGQGQVYSEYDFPGAGLSPGDVVMTGRESSAELQLLPGGWATADEYTEQEGAPSPLVKLAEGSTLRFYSYAGGEATLELLYGQMRVVSAALSDFGGGNLKVKAGNAVMDVSGGDFNLDYMIHPGESLIEKGRNGSMRLQVYSFRGSTDILLSGTNGTTTFTVSEYERVAIEAGSTRSVIERKPLDPSILYFWESMPFAGESPEAAPGTALPSQGSRLVMNENGEERYIIFPVIDSESAALAVERRQAAGGEAPPLPGARKRLVLKNAFLIAGTVLSGIGLGANLYGTYSSGPSAEMAANYGYIPLGIGVVSLIVACIINPRIP